MPDRRRVGYAENQLIGSLRQLSCDPVQFDGVDDELLLLRRFGRSLMRPTLDQDVAVWRHSVDSHSGTVLARDARRCKSSAESISE
ncbi:hypothetical protein ES5_00360 [Dietzia cinnamea P4]|nr:hypothetical protein ES5_00360 [Dietzia cinnamea P4]